MRNKEQDILYFIAFCSEGYKDRTGLSGETVSELFDRKGIKQYLAENYEVLHTQSLPWILEEIEQKLKQ